MFNNFNQYSQPMQGNFSGNSTMTSQQRRDTFLSITPTSFA